MSLFEPNKEKPTLKEQEETTDSYIQQIDTKISSDHRRIHGIGDVSSPDFNNNTTCLTAAVIAMIVELTGMSDEAFRERLEKKPFASEHMQHVVVSAFEIYADEAREK